MTLSIRILTLVMAIAFVALIPQRASAQRLGPDRGGTITGNDAVPITIFPDPSAPACRAYCEKTSNCTGFTWVKPGAYKPRDPAMCYVFSNWTQMRSNSCCISGVQESSTSSLGQIWQECETYTREVCGTWTLGADRWQGQWGPVRADLIIVGDGNNITVTRRDIGSQLQATYRGTRNGSQITGTVEWWGDNLGRRKGTWRATIRPSTGPCNVSGTCLTGRWSAGNYVYNIIQKGDTFTWTREGSSEVGQGTIAGDDVSASWTGGGPATGRITQRDSSGIARRIDWSNGVAFTR